MDTIAKNKYRKFFAIEKKPLLSAKTAAARTRKMVPGKSLEQIRIEAVRQLREIGVLA